MSNEITGQISHIGEVQTFASGFTKRVIVLNVQDGEYENIYPFEFTKDKCSLLDKYVIGQTVTVGFNIRGNEWNGKYFVSLNGWMVKSNAESQDPPPMDAPAPSVPSATPSGSYEDEEDSEIPF